MKFGTYMPGDQIDIPLVAQAISRPNHMPLDEANAIVKQRIQAGYIRGPYSSIQQPYTNMFFLLAGKTISTGPNAGRFPSLAFDGELNPAALDEMIAKFLTEAPEYAQCTKCQGKGWTGVDLYNACDCEAGIEFLKQTRGSRAENPMPQ